MSDRTTVLDAEHSRYLARLTHGDDPFLADLKHAAEKAGLPQIWISPEQASLFQILVKSSGVREVVEVGTLAGYSAIALARALPPGGRVRTIEISPRHADFAEQWIARSDVANKIEVHRGAGDDVLRGFADGSVDLLFVDADKVSYPKYLAHGRRLVRPGGLILVDNAFAFGRVLEKRSGDADVEAIRAFNEELARSSDLHSIIVPLGDGTWVGVRQ
jgi:predicted O-methyltransferase YrrM